jgi:hypothetical protein
MGTVSKPLLGVLLATVIFAVLWVVALKPGGSGSGGGLGRYQGAINAAHHAVAIANDSGVSSGTPVTTTVSKAPAVKPHVTKSVAARVVTHRATHLTASDRQNIVDRALVDHKVLALLFYNPAAADDTAVARELDGLSLRSPKLVKLAVPISELWRYSALTNQVAVQSSPTLIIVNAKDEASTIVGFTDTLEIRERIADALAS